MKFDNLNDFSKLTYVGVIVVDEDGEIKFSTPAYKKSEEILKYLTDLLDSEEHCGVVMVNCCYQSFRFNGRYIFMCPRGFTWTVSPIVRENERVLYALAGPMLMTSIDDYIEFDVESKVSTYDESFLRSQLESIPIFDPSRIPLMSEQLCLNAYYLGDGSYHHQQATYTKYKNTSAGIRLNEYFESYSDAEITEKREKIISEEQKLIQALELHDIQPARDLLNAILGHILFQSGKNLEFIKSRILELVVLLSRAAIRDGADPAVIGKLKESAYEQIDEQENFEEMVTWLNGILDRFKNHIFVDPKSRHASVIHSTVKYILNNFSEKITLEDAAKKAFLSPTYFSRLFKEETGVSFTNYLNRVRIEQSKQYLSDTSLSIAEISAAVGFEDQSYFTKVFKRFESVSPNKYRVNSK